MKNKKMIKRNMTRTAIHLLPLNTKQRERCLLRRVRKSNFRILLDHIKCVQRRTVQHRSYWSTLGFAESIRRMRKILKSNIISILNK